MKYLLAIFLVAVIAIAFLLLFPQPKVIGHAPNCRTNVKVNATAALMYQSDWDDRFPLRDYWQDALQPYMQNKRYERCPKLQETAPSLQVYGYALNQRLSGQKMPARPESVPLIFDSVNLAKNASGAIDSLPSPGRHEGMNNIAYADGSAKAIRTK